MSELVFDCNLVLFETWSCKDVVNIIMLMDNTLGTVFDMH